MGDINDDGMLTSDDADLAMSHLLENMALDAALPQDYFSESELDSADDATPLQSRFASDETAGEAEVTRSQNQPKSMYLIRRHLISLFVAGLTFILLPGLVGLLDTTGTVLAKTQSFPPGTSPIQLIGGVLLFVSIHLWSVCNKQAKLLGKNSSDTRNVDLVKQGERPRRGKNPYAP